MNSQFDPPSLPQIPIQTSNAPENDTREAPVLPEQRGVLQSALLPLLPQRFPAKPANDGGQEIEAPANDGTTSTGGCPRTTAFEHEPNKEYDQSSARPVEEEDEEAKGSLEAVGALGWLGLEPGEGDDVGRKSLDDDRHHPSRVVTIDGSKRAVSTLGSSTGTTDSWVTLDGSETNAWFPTSHPVERCSSPSPTERKEEPRPFAYRVLPIHGAQCLIKVIASFPKLPSSNKGIRGRVVPSFHPYSTENPYESGWPTIDVAEAPTISSNIYYPSNKPGTYISFTVHQPGSVAIECIARIVSILSPIADGVADPIQYAFTEPRGGDILLGEDGNSRLVVSRIVEVIPPSGDCNGLSALRSMMSGKIAGDYGHTHGLVSYDEARPYTIEPLVAIERHVGDDSEHRDTLESHLGQRTLDSSEQILVPAFGTSHEGRKILGRAWGNGRGTRRGAALRRAGKGKDRRRKALGPQRDPNRSVKEKRKPLLAVVYELKDAESASPNEGRGEGDRGDGVARGKDMRTEKGDVSRPAQRSSCSEPSSASSRRHSTLESSGGPADPEGGVVQPTLSSLGSLDSVLLPAPHQEFRGGEWGSGRIFDSPTLLDDRAFLDTKPRGPPSSFELDKVENGGDPGTARPGATWSGRTFSLASRNGSLELGVADGGRSEVLRQAGLEGETEDATGPAPGPPSVRGGQRRFLLGVENAHTSPRESTERVTGFMDVHDRFFATTSLTTGNALRLEMENPPWSLSRPSAAHIEPSRARSTTESNYPLSSQFDLQRVLAPRLQLQAPPSSLNLPSAPVNTISQTFAPYIPCRYLPHWSPRDDQRMAHLQPSSVDQRQSPPLTSGPSTPQRSRHEYVERWRVQSALQMQSWKHSRPPSTSYTFLEHRSGPSTRLSPLSLIANELNPSILHLREASDAAFGDTDPSPSSSIPSSYPPIPAPNQPGLDSQSKRSSQ